MAGEPATLFVLPVLYAMFIRDTPETDEQRRARLANHTSADHGQADPPPADEWNEDQHREGF